MKAIRLVFVTLLPWVLLVALVVHTVYSTGSTDHTFDNRTKLSRAASGASFLKHVELLCDTGTLKVIRTETWLRPTGTEILSKVVDQEEGAYPLGCSIVPAIPS
jgi:hypothetical protein